MKISQQCRLALETTEEREARLQQMSLSQQSRLASETMEERETHLQQARDNRHERLHAESIAEREIRLREIEIIIRQQWAIDPQVPMFEQQSVHARMTKFHSQLASLQVLACVTCSEKFPGLNGRTVPLDIGHTECVCCVQDKHIPKLYSSGNNMDPGTELTTGQCVQLIVNWGEPERVFYDTRVWANTVSLTPIDCFSYSYVQGLTQVELSV